MGNSSNAVVVLRIEKIQKAGHREDYIVSVLAPTRREREPRVEMRVWVDNQNSNPPFKGLTTRGGFYRMSIDTFNKMVAAAPQIREAYKAAMPEDDAEVPESAVPEAPSLELLGGVTVDEKE